MTFEVRGRLKRLPSQWIRAFGKNKRTVGVLAVVALVAIGYSVGLEIQSRPKFIRHKPPKTKANYAVFLTDSCKFEHFESRGCQPEKALSDLGCEEILKPDDRIGGLTGSSPVALCHTMLRPDNESDPDQGLYRVGGMVPLYARFAIWKPEGFVMLKSPKDIKQMFTPISTQEQALGYVLALTGFDVFFEQSYHRGNAYAVDTIEDSYVKAIPDEYAVHVFDEQHFGCGPHWTSAVDLEVSRDGKLKEIARTKLYHETADDVFCFD